MYLLKPDVAELRIVRYTKAAYGQQLTAEICVWAPCRAETVSTSIRCLDKDTDLEYRKIVVH